MLIRTKLKIVIYLCILLAAMSSVTVFYSLRNMEQKLDERRNINDMVRGIFDLTVLTDEYLLYHEKRPLAQWNRQYNALAGLIEMRAPEPSHRAYLVNLEDEYKDVKKLFSRLIAASNNPPFPDNVELSHRLKSHLQSQILTKNHELVTRADRIEKMVERELLTGQMKTGRLMLGIIAAVCTAVIGLILFVRKDIVRPFEKLNEGVKSISEGNLQVRIGIKARDEIGELSRAFDRMASRLNDVMVSRSSLQEEVTQRKQTEDALNKERDFIAAVLSTAGALVIVVDREGRIVRSNRACEDLTGYSFEEVEGKQFWNMFLLPEEKLSVIEVFQDLQTGSFPNVHENHWISRTGERHLIAWANTALIDEEGRVEYVIGTGIDITEKREAEKALRVAASELEHRVEKRTAEVEEINRRLTQEIENREKLNMELSHALAENQEFREHLKAENIYLKQEINLGHTHKNIVGESEAIKGVLEKVEQVAETDTSVLIQGETGTGKDLVAQAIHNLSLRRDKTMVKVNCAALPPTLIENELFGREKGAYTGAFSRQVGRFEIANGSTIFLDEVSELSIELQGKLLRVLQDGRFERLGATESIEVDVRVIAATNRDLESAIKEGSFRDDLFYRLNVFPIYVPPLRDRKEDIPSLVWTFIKGFERRMGKSFDTISQRSMELLQDFPWPGNVRELKNLIERMMIMCEGEILHVELPSLGAGTNIYEGLTLEAMERKHIQSVLEQTDWRVSGRKGAAEILGLKPTTLNSRMKKLGIKRSVN